MGNIGQGGKSWLNEIEGLIEQKCPEVDLRVENSLTNELFTKKIRNEFHVGDDLVARNIQRGRDHGIPDYSTFRSKICGLSAIRSWKEKPSEISAENWNKFRTTYNNPGDIDAFTGCL